MRSALRRAGDPRVDLVKACLANADLPVEEVQIADSMRARGWGDGVHVANDTFAVLRAGTDQPRGVAVVCGAGINCVGLLPDGRTARFLALGHMTGDWGGGMGLGAGGDVVVRPRRGRQGAGDRPVRGRRGPLRAAERDGGGGERAPAPDRPRAVARARAVAVPGGRRR